MCMNQINVRTAFLSGVLSGSMCVKSGCGIPEGPSKVYKLNKALQVLKCAHVARHPKFCQHLGKLKYKELSSAPCEF